MQMSKVPIISGYVPDIDMSTLKKYLLNKMSDEFASTSLRHYKLSRAYQPLQIIVNKSLRQCKYPSSWKNEHVTAIFRKGDSSLPSNYRPISLIRDRPFNLKGGGYDYLFRSEKKFRTTQGLEYFFFCRAKREIFFQQITLGYMTKTLNQIIFFSSTKIRIFFSATLGIRIFF